MWRAFRTRRRRVGYSLRGLLSLVTVVAVLLGWQVSVVRARREAIERIEHNGGYAVVWHRQDVSQMMCGTCAESYLDYGEVRIPRFRAMLGDEPISWIEVRSDADVEFARAHFPEAGITLRGPDDATRDVFPALVSPVPFAP